MLCLPDVLNSSILDVLHNDPYPGRLCFKMILIRLCFKMILIRCFKMIRAPKRAKARASDDSKSEAASEASNGQSVSTASTWASSPPKKHWKQWTEPQKRWMQALTADEEKQARKVEKKLREIAALEARLAEGGNLGVLAAEEG